MCMHMPRLAPQAQHKTGDKTIQKVMRMIQAHTATGTNPWPSDSTILTRGALGPGEERGHHGNGHLHRVIHEASHIEAGVLELDKDADEPERRRELSGVEVGRADRIQHVGRNARDLPTRDA